MSTYPVFPDRNEIATLVEDYFSEQGKEFDYDPDSGLGTYEDCEFSVHNLAANLAKIDRKRWADYVAWHFGHMVVGGPPELPASYEEVRRRLRVRLASAAMVESLPEEITRPVADDLHELLMVAIDEGATTVPPNSIEQWGEPLDRLWKDAHDNTGWDEPTERQLAVKPTGERFVWVRGSWWTASLLLHLGRYLSRNCRHGALAMVPVRDALFYHEIEDETVVSTLIPMMETAVGIHFEGPDPISPHLYWWKDGEIRRVAAYENGRVQPVWGAEFSAMLAEVEAEVTDIAAGRFN